MRRSLILFVLVAALAGCGGSSESAPPTQPPLVTTQPTTPTPPPKPSRLFAKAELPRLALRSEDAPAGLRLTKATSGPKSLSDVGIVVERQLKQMRTLGFRGVYDVMFDSTSSASDLRLASRLWLFASTGGASRWLAKAKGDSEQFGVPRIPAPLLGDESFAAAGGVAGSEIVTHAFRVSNLVVVVSFLSQKSVPSQPAALDAARDALARTNLS